jgi:hypothetical protein
LEFSAEGERKKRIYFIDMTRSYQRFIGAAVNIIDLIIEYNEAFNSLHEIIIAGTHSLSDYTALRPINIILD